MTYHHDGGSAVVQRHLELSGKVLTGLELFLIDEDAKSRPFEPSH